MHKKLIFVVGPTGSGKSDLAIQIAQKCHQDGKTAEIINADSVQVFDGLDIGSAKPPLEDLNKVKHHLIGHIPKGEDYTSGRFRRDVLGVLENSECENFIIVGGSGFYLKGLTHGLFEIPEIPRAIRNEVIDTPREQLFKELKKVDPISAKKLNENDSYRIQRAIEIFRAFGKPISVFRSEFEQKPLPYPFIKIGLKLPKEDLRERVRIRAQKMLDQGLVVETEKIMDEGFEDWKALQSVGYKEVGRFLNEELEEFELLEEIIKSTMSLSKRQMTWFKKDPETTWFEVPTELDSAVLHALEFLNNKKS